MSELMHVFSNFVVAHSTALALGAYLVFSMLVTALPRNRKDFDLYTYCWTVLNGIAGALRSRMGETPANPLQGQEKS